MEIPKFKAEYDTLEDVSGTAGQKNPLLQWLYLLTKGYQSEEEMEMLQTRTAGMENFSNLYTAAIADQKLRDRYEYELSIRLDENSRLYSAREKGKAEGYLAQAGGSLTPNA